MQIVFLGDEHHRYFQEKQVATLQRRAPDLEVLFWSTSGFQVFSQLDALADKDQLFLIGSRHGAIPAAHWTARNPAKVCRQVLLHPSLHLNMPGLEAPQAHFVSTMIICHNKVVSPSHEDISDVAGKFFHDYTFHITPEPAELGSSLSLLTLPSEQ